MTWPFHQDAGSWSGRGGIEFQTKESNWETQLVSVYFFRHVHERCLKWSVATNHLSSSLPLLLFNTARIIIAMTFHGLTTVNGSIVTFLSASGSSKQNPEQVVADAIVFSLHLASVVQQTNKQTIHLCIWKRAREGKNTARSTAQPKNLHAHLGTYTLTDTFKRSYTLQCMYMSIVRLNQLNGMGYGIIYKYDWSFIHEYAHKFVIFSRDFFFLERRQNLWWKIKTEKMNKQMAVLKTINVVGVSKE